MSGIYELDGALFSSAFKREHPPIVTVHGDIEFEFTPRGARMPPDGPAMREALRRAAARGDEQRRRYEAGENVGWPYPNRSTPL